MRVQINVAIYSVLIAFFIVFFSWLFDYISNKPLVENGVQIIHVGVDNKRRM